MYTFIQETTLLKLVNFDINRKSKYISSVFINSSIVLVKK